jgi:hypothetical protein
MINDSKMKPHVQFAKALEALSITIMSATVSCITATSLTSAAIASDARTHGSLACDQFKERRSDQYLIMPDQKKGGRDALRIVTSLKMCNFHPQPRMSSFHPMLTPFGFSLETLPNADKVGNKNYRATVTSAVGRRRAIGQKLTFLPVSFRRQCLLRSVQHNLMHEKKTLILVGGTIARGQPRQATRNWIGIRPSQSIGTGAATLVHDLVRLRIYIQKLVAAVRLPYP